MAVIDIDIAPGAEFDAPLEALHEAFADLDAVPIRGFAGGRADVIELGDGAIVVHLKDAFAPLFEHAFEPGDRVGDLGVVRKARRLAYADTSRTEVTDARAPLARELARRLADPASTSEASFTDPLTFLVLE